MPAARSTRSKASKSPTKATARLTKSNPRHKRKTISEDEDNEDTSSSDDGDDVYEDPASVVDEGDDEDAKSIDSDALDDDETIVGKSRKRKHATFTKTSPKKKSPRKKGNNDEFDDGLELKEGQEVVGTVVQAPKTGRGMCVLCLSRLLTLCTTL